MKVTSINQSINNVKANQKSQQLSATAPMKSDSVSFCGNKITMAESLLDLVKRSKTMSFVEDLNGKITIDADGSIFRLVERKVKSFGFFAKESTKYHLENAWGKGVKKQELDKATFEQLTTQVKAVALPKVLNKYGLEHTSIIELLKDIGTKTVNKTNIPETPVRLSNGQWIAQVLFQFNEKDNFSVGLLHNRHQSANPVHILELKSFEKDKAGDILVLKNAKEIEKFNQVLELGYTVSAKNRLDNECTKLLENVKVTTEAAHQAESKFESFNKTRIPLLKEIEKTISSELDTLNK